MGLELLIGSREHTWRQWLRQNQGARDLLILDPLHAALGPPTRLVLVRDEQVVAWRFVGALDPLRNPIDMLAGAEALLGEASPDCVALLYAWRDSPLARHLTDALARVLRPASVLVAEGARTPADGWPAGAEAVSLEPALPQMVLSAQRRAKWMEFLRSSKEQTLHLDSVRLIGARLGSGRLLNMANLKGAGLQGGLRAELCGDTLLLISTELADDDVAARTMNLAGASRVVVQVPDAYNGLVCSLEREDGTPIALGALAEPDFAAGRLRVRTPAASTKAVRVLRVGALRIDFDGRELGHVRPWSL